MLSTLQTFASATTLWQLALLSIVLVPLYVLLRKYVIDGVPCTSKERLDGKTVIITGGNAGIGKATAIDLACRGAKVILGCRSASRGAAALKEIKERSGNERVVLKQLDLASCTSIRQFAREILEEETRVDVLICNAGILFPPYQLTEDGFELTFGVNHLGHFLLTNLLLDRLKGSAPSRVVVVSSLGHLAGSLDFKDMMWTKRHNRYLAYCRSKLANVMFAKELARRLHGTGVTVCALHPGTVNSELYVSFMSSGWLIILRPILYIFRYLLAKTPQQGAQTSIHCAVAREVEGISGKYWDQCAIKEPSSQVNDEAACRQLWEYSAKLVEIE